MHGKRRGFTLIEVMVVVAVIGILSAISLPSYLDYIRKSRRVDAKNALLDMAARQERFFSINNTYTDDFSKLGYAGASGSIAVNSSGTSYYALSVAVTPASLTALPAFIAKAEPTGSQIADTACHTFRLNQLGVQDNVNSEGTVFDGKGCW